MVMDNSVTLNSYENNVDKYVEGTPSVVDGDMKSWLDRYVQLLPAKSRVFEIGSGTGRDAEYLTSCGVEVTCSDATVEFVKRLTVSGYDTVSFNALDAEKYPEGFNSYLANAVFLHFSVEETKTVLSKIWDVLPNKGVLAFSVKMEPEAGVNSEWVNTKLDAPRFFQYWKPENIVYNVLSVGFTGLDVTFRDGWIFVIAMKRV